MNQPNLEQQKKEKVAFDIDGTLGEFHPLFLEFFNERNKTRFSVDDIFSYKLWDVLNHDKEEIFEEILGFYQSPLFRAIPPVIHAQNLTRNLLPRYRLSILTSRPDFVREETLRWLDEHFPNTFSDVHFTNQFAGDGMEKKSDFCLQHGYKFLVEDSHEYANECAGKGIKVFLLTRPWNWETLHPNIKRVNKLNEVLQYLI